MDGQTHPDTADVQLKISRLVRERGWNQEDFARLAGLNRQTVHQILRPGSRRLRNATVSACADALGLSVRDLVDQPLDQLLPRMHEGRHQEGVNGVAGRLYDKATQPELIAWLERNPERAAQLSEQDMEELLSLQGVGGPLTRIGVDHFINLIERKRRLIERIHTIAGTEYLDLLEKLVDLMHEKIQPYRDRK